MNEHDDPNVVPFTGLVQDNVRLDPAKILAALQEQQWDEIVVIGVPAPEREGFDPGPVRVHASGGLGEARLLIGSAAFFIDSLRPVSD